MVKHGGVSEANLEVLREAQAAFNAVFGTLLCAGIGHALTAINDRVFDIAMVIDFLLAVAWFAVALCIGNQAMLRGEQRKGMVLLVTACMAGLVAFVAGQALGLDNALLRLLTGAWVATLLGSNATVSLIDYIQRRGGQR